MKKYLSVVILCVLVAVSCSQKPKQLWLKTTNLANPESTHYDPTTNIIYVSNCNGGSQDRDGNGFIAKWDLSGKVIEEKWITGLDAPKGVRVANGKLYTTDVDKIIVADIASGKIERAIQVEGSKFLNDTAIGPDGTVYFSDTFANKIFELKPTGEVGVFLEDAGLEGPNGLYVDGGFLYNAAYGVNDESLKTTRPGHLMRINLRDKKIENITKEPLGNLDGLEKMSDGRWIVTDWIIGKVYIVDQQGNVKKIMDGFDGSADIGYLPDKKILIVPHQNDSKLSAYSLDKW